MARAKLMADAAPYEYDELAHKYKKLVASLDPKIEMRLDGRIAIIESQMRGRGEKPEDTPIELITEAAGIVLEEESNQEILKALRSGRGNALSAQGRFDPQRNTRDQPAGGQTWSNAGPTVHTSDMRDCWFCTNKYKDTPMHMRKHVDLDCPNATKQEKDALRKERVAKVKAKRDKWNERHMGGVVAYAWIMAISPPFQCSSPFWHSQLTMPVFP